MAENYDEIDEKVRKRRVIVFAGLLALVIVGSVILYFWGSFINRGTLLVYGQPPFSVEIFQEEEFVCNSSPCEITYKSGQKQLILRKEGYEGIVTEAEIKLWQKNEINVEFKLIGYTGPTDQYPQENQYKYRLVDDFETGMQKLISADDSRQNALAYFPKEIKNIKIVGSQNFVLLIDKNPNNFKAYKVNLQTRQKNLINLPELVDVDNGKWSLNGDYFVFNFKDDDGLYLLNLADQNPQITQLDFQSDLENMGWINEQKLIFVLEADEKYFFALYSPETNSYEIIENSVFLDSKPQEIAPLLNGNSVYYMLNGEKYKFVTS